MITERSHTCTNGCRPMPVPIAATADLSRPQQEVARGASDMAGGVQCVAALVGAVQMAVQELGGRGAFHHWRRHKQQDKQLIQAKSRPIHLWSTPRSVLELEFSKP